MLSEIAPSGTAGDEGLLNTASKYARAGTHTGPARVSSEFFSGLARRFKGAKQRELAEAMFNPRNAKKLIDEYRITQPTAVPKILYVPAGVPFAGSEAYQR